jgi:hypothetical protein
MSTSTWVAFGLAAIPAVAAIAAAWLASRSARQARLAQADADHLQRLEQRLADHKREVYQPMIEFMGKMLDGANTPPEKVFKQKLTEFSRWVVVVGSDEAVRAFRNMMQASFNDAPTPLYLRLYADFQLAARRDMGDPNTTLTPIDVMGMRINDLYSNHDDTAVFDVLTKPFAEVCSDHSWPIPWERTPLAGGGATPTRVASGTGG